MERRLAVRGASRGRIPRLSQRCISGVRVGSDLDAPSFAMAGLRPDNDLHVLAERGQEPHQALAGEVREAAVEQGRDLRLIDSHKHCRSNLG